MRSAVLIKPEFAVLRYVLRTYKPAPTLAIPPVLHVCGGDRVLEIGYGDRLDENGRYDNAKSRLTAYFRAEIPVF